ncbi:MAG: hypothetical protein DME42_12000 [Verrucomicrobia bacterium]|nr:MAG: hypothetical protein DME42_12000 [Verrucomicrobiota bacterium]
MLILLGHGEVIKSSIFLGRATGVIETNLAGDGATRRDNVILKYLGELILQLTPQQQKIDASLD